MAEYDPDKLVNDSFFDDNAHQACYIFKPFEDQNDLDDRPTKKRRISKKEADQTARTTWPRLLGGAESIKCAQLREKTSRELWNKKKRILQDVSDDFDQGVLDDLVHFARDGTSSLTSGKIRTGLFVTGSDSVAQQALLENWKTQAKEDENEAIIQLPASQASNLQIALKNIIKTVIEEYDSVQGYINFVTQKKRLIPMNYDLELLEKFTQEHAINRIILSISDIETLDLGVFSELVKTLSSWQDRLNVVLLLGIATTVELFESRLSRSTIKLLDAKIFEVARRKDRLYDLMNDFQNDFDTMLFLGPSAVSALFEMTKEQTITLTSFSRALEYIYMTHFFANSLSVLLSPSLSEEIEDFSALCAAIRNTNSFQNHCGNLLKKDKEDRETVRRLLNDDKFLLETARTAIQEGKHTMHTISKTISTVRSLHDRLNLPPVSPFEIHLELLNPSTEFTTSESYDQITNAINPLDPSTLQTLLTHDSLDHLSNFSPPSKAEDIPTLPQILKSLNHHHHLLLPDEDRSNTTKSQKSQSKRKSTTTSPTTISTIQTSIVSLLKSYLTTNLPNNPANLLLNECFLYNQKSSSSKLITTLSQPRPRAVLERALTRPADYLGCECCFAPEGDANATATTDQIPSTSLLFSLLNEAGSLVNVRDLWDAFFHRHRHHYYQDDEDGEIGDKEEDKEKEKGLLSQFYTSLAELKMLGFVRSGKSRRPPGFPASVEVIARGVWRGL